MKTRQHSRAGLQRLLLPATCALVIAYFAHHAKVGDLGLESYERLKVREAELSERLSTMKTERSALETRVSLLRAESVDVDLVDERARRLLGFQHKDEIVVPLPAPAG